MANEKPAARSLVRAADKLAKQKRNGEDTSRQSRKVDKAIQLFENAKKKKKS